MYLVAGDGKGFELEQNQCEETDDQHYDRHLVVADDADGQHENREDQDDATPDFQPCLDLLNSVNHYYLYYYYALYIII